MYLDNVQFTNGYITLPFETYPDTYDTMFVQEVYNLSVTPTTYIAQKGDSSWNVYGRIASDGTRVTNTRSLWILFAKS